MIKELISHFSEGFFARPSVSVRPSVCPSVWLFVFQSICWYRDDLSRKCVSDIMFIYNQIQVIDGHVGASEFDQGPDVFFFVFFLWLACLFTSNQFILGISFSFVSVLSDNDEWSWEKKQNTRAPFHFVIHLLEHRCGENLEFFFFLVACYATLHPAFSVRSSVRRYVTLYFFGIYGVFGSTAPAQMLHWPQIWPLPTRTRLG